MPLRTKEGAPHLQPQISSPPSQPYFGVMERDHHWINTKIAKFVNIPTIAGGVNILETLRKIKNLMIVEGVNKTIRQENNILNVEKSLLHIFQNMIINLDIPPFSVIVEDLVGLNEDELDKFLIALNLLVQSDAPGDAQTT